MEFNDVYEFPNLKIMSSQRKSTLVVDGWYHCSGTCWTDALVLAITSSLLLFPNFQKRHKELRKTDDRILVVN